MRYVNPFHIVSREAGGRWLAIGSVLQVALPRFDVRGRGARARTKSETLALVAEMRAFLNSIPAPWIDDAWEQMRNATMAAGTREDQRVIWQAYTNASMQKNYAAKVELAGRFGGLVRLALNRFEAIGAITPIERSKIEWYAESRGFLGAAATALEALALAL